MVVNWKNHESIDRLIASLLAAHPDLKLDYHAMVLFFGQGSTYDSIEGRFLADELRDEAHSRGIKDIPRKAGRNYTSVRSATSTPRTPRGPRGITKSTPSSSRSRNCHQTPTMRKTKPGRSVMDAIYVDDVDTEEESKIKPEIPGVPSDSGEDDVKVVDSPSIKIKKERVEHNMAGLFNSAMTPKKEEEISGLGISAVSTPARGIQGHDDGARYPVGMNEDPFSMIGDYLKHEHGGNMDDIYRGAA